MDTIFYRSESNAEYIWGTSAAFISAFMVTGMLSLGLGALIHLSASEAPFNILIYLFYLFTLILPSIVFTLGFSIAVVNWIKNRAISLIILLGSMFVLVFYTRDFQKGILDPLGLTLPNAFSGITGHPDLNGYLLQRGFWLLVGLSFIHWTTLSFFRIPNNPKRTRSREWFLVCMTSSLLLGSFLFYIHRTELSLRRKYISTYEKYSTAKHGTLVEEEINYRQQGNKMIGQASMTVRNETPEELEEIIIYLNPSLEITSIKHDGKEVSYKREHQVISVKKNLPVAQDMKLLIHYEGHIDENVCYPDVPEKLHLNTNGRSYMTCRYGKRYAFLERGYTLLTPEALWYPVTIPPVNLHVPYNSIKNFTRYTLNVMNPGGKTVISQGEKRISGDTIVFHDQYPLPGISLCMGDYKRRTVTFDSITYELNVFREHSSLLENMKWLNNSSALQEFLSDLNSDIRFRMGEEYPYRHFILTETPVAFTSYFRNSQGGSGYVQPEIVFLPERGIGIWNDFKYISTLSLKKTLLNTFTNTGTTGRPFSFDQFIRLPLIRAGFFNFKTEKRENPYTLVPLFYNYAISIQSNDYPIIQQVLVSISRPAGNESRLNESKKLTYQATRYLTRHSLKDALADNRISAEELNYILQLKANDLVSRFQVKGIDRDSLVSFTRAFLENHRSQLVDFSRYNQLFTQQFGMDGMDILPAWFTQDQLPRFLVKDFSAYTVKEITEMECNTLTRVEFSVFNDSPVDGIITIQLSGKSPSGASAGLSLGGEPKIEFIPAEYSYLIAAGTGREIALVHRQYPLYITLNTNLSGNIPRYETISPVEDIPNISTTSFSRAIDKDYFRCQPGEIIVDNEDDGFIVHQSPSGQKLRSILNKRQSIEEKYGNLTSIMEINDTWKFYVDESTFGKIIRSAVTRKAGNGTSSVEWNATIHEEGEYNIYVYLPKTSFLLYRGFRAPFQGTEKMADTQTYLISSGTESKKVVINTYGQEGWVPLGRFYLTPGNHKVSLSDQGQPDQLIIGDAVKWEYCQQ